jgi:hypothetical protein
VVNATASPPRRFAGVKRTVPLLVEYAGIVALAFMAASPLRQRSGNRWAHTYVVDRNTIFELRSARDVIARAKRMASPGFGPGSK